MIWNECELANIKLINTITGKQYKVLEFKTRDNYRFFKKLTDLANKRFNFNGLEELIIDDILLEPDFVKDGFDGISYMMDAVALMINNSTYFAYTLSIKIQIEKINTNLFNEKHLYQTRRRWDKVIFIKGYYSHVSGCRV